MSASKYAEAIAALRSRADEIEAKKYPKETTIGAMHADWMRVMGLRENADWLERLGEEGRT